MCVYVCVCVYIYIYIYIYIWLRQPLRSPPCVSLGLTCIVRSFRRSILYKRRPNAPFPCIRRADTGLGLTPGFDLTRAPPGLTRVQGGDDQQLIQTPVSLCKVLSTILSRRRGHLHARALQIRAVLSTHIHTEQGSRPSRTDLEFS